MWLIINRTFLSKKQFFSSIFLARLKVYCAIFHATAWQYIRWNAQTATRFILQLRLVLSCVPPGLLRLFLSTQLRNMYNMSRMKDNIKLDAILQNGNWKRRRSVSIPRDGWSPFLRFVWSTMKLYKILLNLPWFQQ